MMKTTLHSENGSSLMVALFAITILAMLAILMVSRGTAGMRDTRAFRDHQSAFQAAEAGLEHARKLLNDGSTDTWDTELTAQYGADLVTGEPGAAGTADDTLFIAETTLVAGQTYIARIEDNADDDPSPVIDEDNRIWIISTGTAGGKTTTIRELVRNNAQDSHISQEHYGEHSLGWATTE